jgi:hypothetical protein
MIHQNSKSEEIHEKLVKKVAEDLIQEHRRGRTNCEDCIGHRYDMHIGVYAAIVTSRKLAQETGKKIYYSVASYLEEKYREEYNL